MNMFKGLSLRVKMILVSGGMAVIIIVASFSFFQELRTASVSARRAQEVLVLLEQASGYFDQMTIGMRGYILDPSRSDEWAFKLKADENAVSTLEKVQTMATNAKLLETLREIAEFDSKQMNRLENEFGALVDRKEFVRAQRFYFETYMPVRARMEKMVTEAADLAERDRQSFSAEEERILVKGGGVLLVIITASLFFSLLFNNRLAGRVTSVVTSFTDKLGTSVLSIELASKNTASASQQIATSATENASAITETLSISESGKRESEKGKEVVSRMSDTMAQVSEANARLESLIKVIEDIQSKTKVINDIVFETRLLSFNASIEAARAGSHGKGFAVVAEEVGKLAAVSGKAAEEINGLLASSTHQVKEIVAMTSQRVGAAREASGECEQVFTQMSHSMAEINRAMMDMERETHHNSASSEEMANQAQTLAIEAKALTGLLGQLRSLIKGGSDEGTSAVGPVSAPVFERPASPVVPLSSVRPQAAGGDSGSTQVDRNDSRWKAA